MLLTGAFATGSFCISSCAALLMEGNTIPISTFGNGIAPVP